MKKRLYYFIVLGMVLSSGCGNPSQENAQGLENAGNDTIIEIAVIPKGLAHQFWIAVKNGAEAAARDFGVVVNWQGPAKETEIAQQINIVQDMVARGVKAIVLAACDENALVSVVEQVDRAGIPIIMIDSGVKSDIPKSLVATDNSMGAKMAADVLADLLDEKGSVGLMPFVPGAATSEMREQGFKQGLEAYPDMRLAAVNYSQSDVATGMNVVSDMLTAHPDLAGIFAANEAGAIGAAQALRTAGKIGQVKLVAFDASGEQIAALKEGVIQALIVQNPYKMGYEGVKAALDVLQGKPVEPRIDTGVTVITLENLDSPEVQSLLSAS